MSGITRSGKPCQRCAQLGRPCGTCLGPAQTAAAASAAAGLDTAIDNSVAAAPAADSFSSYDPFEGIPRDEHGEPIFGDPGTLHGLATMDAEDYMTFDDMADDVGTAAKHAIEGLPTAYRNRVLDTFRDHCAIKASPSSPQTPPDGDGRMPDGRRPFTELVDIDPADLSPDDYAAKLIEHTEALIAGNLVDDYQYFYGRLEGEIERAPIPTERLAELWPDGIPKDRVPWDWEPATT